MNYSASLKKEISFLLFFGILSALVYFSLLSPVLAMWLGFSLAAFSAIGNDSIQTLGTFLTSNEKVRWQYLWLFVGGIFVLTITYAYFTQNGAIDFGRLKRIEPVAKENLTFLHVFAPAILLLLTRYRIPVSTTFLILAVFSSTKTIESMVIKTFVGWGTAFFVAIFVWFILERFFHSFFTRSLSKTEESRWRFFQWGSTAFLWMTWLSHDVSNIAVFLPRTLSVSEFLLAIFLCTGMIGFLLFQKGGAIQDIVREKKDVTDVRAATAIDITLTIVLLFFKELNDLPMSTTWVFLGLLAGRELILCHMGGCLQSRRALLKLIGKDIGLASIGLAISVLLAALVH